MCARVRVRVRMKVYILCMCVPYHIGAQCALSLYLAAA